MIVQFPHISHDNYVELGEHFLNILQTAIESLDFQFYIYIDSLTGGQV